MSLSLPAVHRSRRSKRAFQRSFRMIPENLSNFYKKKTTSVGKPYVRLCATRNCGATWSVAARTWIGNRTAAIVLSRSRRRRRVVNAVVGGRTAAKQFYISSPRSWGSMSEWTLRDRRIVSRLSASVSSASRGTAKTTIDIGEVSMGVYAWRESTTATFFRIMYIGTKGADRPRRKISRVRTSIILRFSCDRYNELVTKIYGLCCWSGNCAYVRLRKTNV